MSGRSTIARQSGGARRAVVVGASLAGLMTALSLVRAGFDVSLLERAADSGRTGAALQIGDAVIERLTGRKDGPAFDGARVQTWTAVHAHLRAVAEGEPKITILDGISVVKAAQDAGQAWAIDEEGRAYAGDVLAGADGYRSIVRRAVAPDKPDAHFAGYLIWIGIAHERDLGPAGPWPTGTLYEEAADYILLGSPLPGEDGSTRRGDRRIGWAWYDAERNDLLRDAGAVIGNTVQHTLLAGEIPGRTFTELDRDARLWPAPWRQAIRDCVRRRAVICTPIAEYLPDRLVRGRICLVGDAAHVPTPMTGNGFSASLDDALALGSALSNHDGVPSALAAYAGERLPTVRRLVRSGQDFSRCYVAGRSIVG